MAKATPVIAAFNAGEWSPLLDGRVDLQGYSASGSAVENFIPTVQGPLIRRGGTRFVAEVEDSAERSWLVPFIRSRSVAYVIEFGDEICRFYTDRAQVVSGTPYEIVSPYTAAELVNSQGEFMLDFVQSADVLYITSRNGDRNIRKLSRTSSTSWAFSTLQPDDGPFAELNATSATIYASAATGAGITLTASTSVFTANDVGSLIRLEQENLATDAWVTGTGYTAGDFVRSEGHEYEAANSATSGTSIPVHTYGKVSDGGVEWTYRSSGYGVARITAQGGTTATATVLKRFPESVVGSGNPTTLWRFGAWSLRNGLPETVSFFNERLCFGRGQSVFMSEVANFESFSPDRAGEILPESAVTVTIQSAEVNDIMALVETKGALGVHTEGGEAQIGSLTDSEPFGPGNIRVSVSSAYGSRPVKPVRVGEATLFLQASGKKVRETVFDIQVDNLVSRDMTVRAEHITAPRVTAMARQEEPHQLVWMVRSDGQLVCLTYDRTQEVRGWARHIIGGDAVVESAAVIPSPDGTRDDLWLIARRTIDGGTVRYVEYVTGGHEGDLEDATFLDCSLTYDGSAATTISGLDHLEGETVCVLADGATHPDATVSGGEITLARSASVVQVGYCPPCVWGSNRLEAGASDGTAQTKTKRITDVAFRVFETLGGSAGPSRTETDDIPDLNYRWAGTGMGSGPDAFTGDALVEWPAGYETDGRIWYVNATAFPVTLIAAVPQVVTQEAR